MAFLRHIRIRLAGAGPLRLRAALLALALLPGAPARAADPAPAPTEYQYQVKAAFLFNFAQFVDWPASAFHGPQDEFVIGVLGADPFGAYLDELVRGEKVGGRPLAVRRFAHVEDIGECHILFVSRSETGQLEKILAPLKGRSLLTVGDMEGFARYGGIVRFVTEKNKIRLRINLEAAKACDLTISSKLLRPATIVAAGND
jgi:hypothetical protein